jgi:uncharacterized protein (DUF2141 family)
MKTFARFTLFFIAATITAHCQTADATCKLIVHMTGFRNAKGDAGVTLFKDTNGWPEDNDKAFKHGPFPIDPATKTSTATFENIPAGTYGFAMIHDENQNHKMDYNFLHIPKEGFGFANNPHVMLSSPSFKDASVNVACPVTEINVTVQYK